MVPDNVAVDGGEKKAWRAQGEDPTPKSWMSKVEEFEKRWIAWGENVITLGVSMDRFLMSDTSKSWT